MEDQETLPEPEEINTPESFCVTDEKVLRVSFTNPANCQFYFGSQNDNNCTNHNCSNNKNKPSVPANNVPDVEIMQATIKALNLKVSELESVNSKLVEKVSIIEERLALLEGVELPLSSLGVATQVLEASGGSPWDGPSPLFSSSSNQRTRRTSDSGRNCPSNRSSCSNSSRGNRESSDSMETNSSETSTITGNISLFNPLTSERLAIRTAAPLPSPSTSAFAATSYKVVARNDCHVTGMTAMEMSKAYPGRLSCVFEIVNWLPIPLLDPQTLAVHGTLEKVPGHIDIAKAFGVSENGRKLCMACTYRLGTLRLAFSVYIDDATSFFKIGFVKNLDETSQSLGEFLDTKENWINVKHGSPKDELVDCIVGGVRLVGLLWPGKKSLMEISVSEAA